MLTFCFFEQLFSGVAAGAGSQPWYQGRLSKDGLDPNKQWKMSLRQWKFVKRGTWARPKEIAQCMTFILPGRRWLRVPVGTNRRYIAG
ncbi:hypothetical protein B0T09DRAFT_326650 [Sordaria sp. MPI-SDFR-AT-0083]|nr:hypothetical protein B0T09DRAFT_326650 [Sordaria sp. MPI-SDFR-AT-0083]